MKFFIVDCFAEEKYQGNELLVVLTEQMISDEEQQKISREINFSETTFVLPKKQENGGYDVRIWTPNVGEVPFAGHPTLGTAHVIRHMLEDGTDHTLLLNLKVGQIPVAATAQGQTMRQNPPRFGEIISKEEIARIYGISVNDILEEYPIQWVSTGLEAVIIPLKNRAALANLRCDKDLFLSYVERHPACNCNHLFFVQTGDKTLSARCLMEDFVEDPATGSANGNLAGYLVKHNFFDSKDITYTVHQGEDMHRHSVLHVHGSLCSDVWTIEVGGNCHIVAEGDWKA